MKSSNTLASAEISNKKFAKLPLNNISKGVGGILKNFLGNSKNKLNYYRRAFKKLDADKVCIE